MEEKLLKQEIVDEKLKDDELNQKLRKELKLKLNEEKCLNAFYLSAKGSTVNEN